MSACSPDKHNKYAHNVTEICFHSSVLNSRTQCVLVISSY